MLVKRKIISAGLNKALNWLGQGIKKKKEEKKKPSALRYKSSGFTDFKHSAGLKKLFTKAAIANACKLPRVKIIEAYTLGETASADANMCCSGFRQQVQTSAPTGSRNVHRGTQIPHVPRV